MREIPVMCFPHAGAGALYYSKWRHAFQGGVDLRIVEYPLRERRLGTPMPASVGLLAEQIFAEFADVFRGTYAVWGHSMGSVIGYEVAKLCQERLDNPPLVYFGSGSSAPCDSRFKRVKDLDSAAGLNDVLRRYGGVGEEILRDAGFVKYIAPVIEADLRLMGGYEDTAKEKLRCPIVLMEGREDEVTTGPWADYTDVSLQVFEYDGGHFFHDAHRARIAALMESKIQTLWQLKRASADRRGPADRLMSEMR
ncbi:thioesterase II family protein [Streptosporangium sp. OZ121]|uniref:thioesterase II family protein n=1 Tax=Streptosporangium sp. OZ121 TaxID=3444183 RepID=UPI003F7A00A3